MATVLLLAGSPRLQDLRREHLELARRLAPSVFLRRQFLKLSRALAELGFLDAALPLHPEGHPFLGSGPMYRAGVPTEWLSLAERWRDLTVLFRVIPLLCRKAGIPDADARGKLTSHRARSTIASLLGNAKEPMTLLELQQWLGHRWPSSTQHYFQILPTKLGRAYADADYFRRNVRTVDVLIDEQTILSGAAANGAPWKYFGLGHGLCANPFYEQFAWPVRAARSIGPSHPPWRQTLSP